VPYKYDIFQRILGTEFDKSIQFRIITLRWALDK